MSTLNQDEVARIARLAHVSIDESEIGTVTDKLQAILGFVDQLQSADVSGVEPTSQVTGLVDVLRDDVVIRSEITRDELLKRAPLQTDGQIQVKRVIR